MDKMTTAFTRIFGQAGFTFVALATSCVSPPQWTGDAPVSANQFRRNLEKWHGASAERLVDVNGYPQRELKSPAGNTVYEYTNSATIHTPGSASSSFNQYGSGYTTIDPGQDVVRQCTRWFELSAGKVVKVSFKGNACVAPLEIVACQVWHPSYIIERKLEEIPATGTPPTCPEGNPVYSED